jgi:hypothetical protein
MIDLLTAAASFQTFCESRGWPFCFIGGLAVLRWGEPRVTRDVDVSLYTGFEHDERVVDELLAAFESRIADPRAFALANRVVLLFGVGKVPLDVGLAGFPFERQVIDRATAFAFGAAPPLRICSAEDLIVLKMFAARPRDLDDVRGIVTRQQDNLAWPYIEAALEPLAVGTDRPELVDLLRMLRRESSSE